MSASTTPPIFPSFSARPSASRLPGTGRIRHNTGTNRTGRFSHPLFATTACNGPGSSWQRKRIQSATSPGRSVSRIRPTSPYVSGDASGCRPPPTEKIGRNAGPNRTWRICLGLRRLSTPSKSPGDAMFSTSPKLIRLKLLDRLLLKSSLRFA